ncbi:MAG: tetratricopeptide repeat protein [Aquificaceae bacterium]
MIRFIVSLFLISVLFSCAAKKENTDTTQWQYLYDLGMSSYIAKNYSEAIANLFRASQLAPNEPKVWNALGLAYMEAQEYEKAERSFLKALEVGKNYTEARLNLGILHYRTSNYQKALEFLRSAIEDEAFPKKHMAFYYLAKTYQAMGNQDEYKKKLLKAVAYNPMFIEAQLELAQVYESEEDYASAQRIYQSLINNDIKDPVLDLNLARIEYKLKNYNTAKNHVKKVIEDQRSSPQLKAQAYDLLSLILMAEQDIQVQRTKAEEVKVETKEPPGGTGIQENTKANPEDGQRKDTEEFSQSNEEEIKRGFYRIQLGDFYSLESAKTWKSKLEKDFNLRYVVIVENSGAYRVLYGSFNNIEEAKKELRRLKDLNIYGFVVVY